MNKLIFPSALFALCLFLSGVRPGAAQQTLPTLSTNVTAANLTLHTNDGNGEYTILEQLLGGVSGTTLSQNSTLTRGSSMDIDKNPLVPLIFAFGWVEKNKDDLDKDSFDEVLFKDANLVSFSGNMAQIFNSATGGVKREIRLFSPDDPEDEEITLNVVGK